MKSHAEVLRPFGAGTTSPLQWEVCCPECGGSNIDREPVGNDHEAVVLQPDRDRYESPLGTRGGYLQVTLLCVEGHLFSVVLANHKGAEFIGVV